MLNKSLYLVIIAGGSGTRFWPKSTSRRPKQLLAFQEKTLLEQTLDRFQDFIPKNQSMIVTTEMLKAPIEEAKLSVEILAEPQGRNTAPCVYWAARHVFEKDPKGVMLVMPSDHYIAYPEKFRTVVDLATQWARERDDLVTLGIQPSRPETGYGYLKTGNYLEDYGHSLGIKKVEAFVEKPNLEKARDFIRAGNYLWNAGMFIWRAEVILDAFDHYMPEMKKVWDQSRGQVEVAYPKMTATSIDYGIMEKAQNVVTFPLDCGWDDLGSWTSLENLAESLTIQQGQNIITSGELLSIESKGNIVDAPGRLVALLGIEDLIVVEHGDAILIAKKDRAQEIRKVVDEVRKIRPDLV